MAEKATTRGQWGSTAGFVLATAGSAIGLANIWAFPYRTGQNGGAVFVVIYLLCVFLISLPFMFAEITLGRYTQKNVVGAIKAIRPKSVWLGLGALSIAAGLFILSFYSVVAGWGVGYIYQMLIGDPTPLPELAGRLSWIIPLFVIFLFLSVLVVYGGIQKGIERWSKVLMPVMALLLLLLIFRSVTLPGAGKGLEFFLYPDFSKITARTLLIALGQAFFSLSLGTGGLLTYGSYLSRKENIVSASLYIVLFDTLIAVMAGLMIFPALFSFGQQPDEGPALVFMILPQIFNQLPLGNILGALFFVMLTIAALTSSISMLEISIAYFVDEKHLEREKIVWIVGILVLLLGLPSALSQGAVPELSRLGFFNGKSFLELMIFLWFDIFPPLGAALFSIFIGWVWGIDGAAKELLQGGPLMGKTFPGTSLKIYRIWGFFIRYVCPAAIFILLLNAFFPLI